MKQRDQTPSDTNHRHECGASRLEDNTQLPGLNVRRVVGLVRPEARRRSAVWTSMRPHLPMGCSSFHSVSRVTAGSFRAASVGRSWRSISAMRLRINSRSTPTPPLQRSQSLDDGREGSVDDASGGHGLRPVCYLCQVSPAQGGPG